MNDRQIEIIKSLIRENTYYGYADSITDVQEVIEMLFMDDDSFNLDLTVNYVTKKLTFSVKPKAIEKKPLPKSVEPQSIAHHSMATALDDYKRMFTLNNVNFYKHKKLDEYARDGVGERSTGRITKISHGVYQMYYEAYLLKFGVKS